MNRIRRHLSFSNVISVLALFIALGGSAYAAIDLVGKNDIKSRHIAPNAVKGTDAKESSFGIVPNSNLLDGQDSSAFLGASAKAADSNLLDGQDSSAFAAADEVHNSGRVTANDTSPGDTAVSTVVLFTAGDFTVRGLCIEDFNGGPLEGALVEVLMPIGSSYSDVDTTNFGEGGFHDNMASVGFGTPAEVESEGNAVGSGYFIAAAPNGQVLSGSASAEVNDTDGGGATCTFAATALGP